MYGGKKDQFFTHPMQKGGNASFKVARFVI
jgi:hypothetical protein